MVRSTASNANATQLHAPMLTGSSTPPRRRSEACALCRGRGCARAAHPLPLCPCRWLRFILQYILKAFACTVRAENESVSLTTANLASGSVPQAHDWLRSVYALFRFCQSRAQRLHAALLSIAFMVPRGTCALGRSSAASYYSLVPSFTLPAQSDNWSCIFAPGSPSATLVQK